jgi:hypothetical protein
MKLDLDPDFLRTSMTMWKDAVDMKINVHDDFKIHFMANRRSLLEGFLKTAAAWSMLLNSCKPAGDADTEVLSALKADVDEFRLWAEQGLLDLSDIAKERHP